jgi:hypothetical protein
MPNSKNIASSVPNRAKISLGKSIKITKKAAPIMIQTLAAHK